MKKLHNSLAAFCLLIPLGICPALAGSSFADAAYMVENGVARDVQIVGAPWITDNDALVGSGEENRLDSAKVIQAGDFTVRASLSIEQLAFSAASIVINDNHFGFEGKKGEMFTEGSFLGSRNLGKPIVVDGKPFKVTIQRTGDNLTIELDGKTIVRAPLTSNTEVHFGLRPHRSTMLVSSLTIAGSLRDAPKPLPQTDVFVRGQGDYHTYRIPAIVATKQGTLLAFCEGRKSGGGDAGNIDMLVSRSKDHGKTWSAPQVVWDDAGNTCGNPAPVVDQETGTIWLPMTWNLGADHERDIMAGKSQNARQVYVTHSTDDGLTWAKPRKISDTTRKPHWRWYATGPGNAIQLTRGAHKGRLLIPCNHSDHGDAKTHPYRSHVIWSDDHGKTWTLGGVHQDRTNESAVVERADGSVLQAMRSYHGKNKRAMSVSTDGGESWSDVYLDDMLETPVCQANILRYSWPEKQNGKSRILFSSPHGGSRTKMTIWLSYDEGKTWPVPKLIHAGGSAYSNLIALTDGQVGLLFEKDGYKSISFVTVSLAWLESDQ